MSAVNFAYDDISELENHAEPEQVSSAIIRLRNFFEKKTCKETSAKADTDLTNVEAGKHDPDVFDRLRTYVAETK